MTIDREALGTRTWPDVRRGATVLVPVGSVEQHGPHLPLDTDTRIAVAVSEHAAREAVAKAGHEVVVAPAVSFGASGEHQSFAGTSSIGTEALRLVVLELVRSLHTWAGRVVLVNGHGGNLPALRSAVDQLESEQHDVHLVPCASPDGDAHAGRTETSLLLHLAPGVVHLERAEPGSIRPLAELLPEMVEHGVVAVSPNGVLGDPAGATAEEGAVLFAAMVEAVRHAL